MIQVGKRLRRFLAGILAAALCLCVPVVPAAAAGEQYVSVEQAIVQLRDALRAHKPEVTLYIRSSLDFKQDKATRKLLFDPCVSPAYADGYDTGDYLKDVWGGHWSVVYPQGNNLWKIRFYNIEYDTTLAQEQAFAARLQQVMDQLDLWTRSDYYKYRGIYAYITENVRYDEETYSGSAPDKMGYTAYSALMNGKAVCQGYSALFYAMCQYMGLPVRMVSGEGDGRNGWGGHAWNIVQLGGLWYQVDATWDEGKAPSKWEYFLMPENMPRHRLDEEYTTAAWKQAYPMAATAYRPTAADELPVCRFRDIAASDYYYEAAWALSDQGIISGTGPYTFSADDGMTRAMMLTMLYRMAGSPAVSGDTGFTDVAANAYYAQPVVWAVQQGIATGYGSGRFGPNDRITREQLAVFLYRYAQQETSGEDTVDVILAPFADQGQISAYARDALAWAVTEGVIQGMNGDRVRPQGTATRGQAATMLYRMAA